MEKMAQLILGMAFICTMLLLFTDWSTYAFTLILLSTYMIVNGAILYSEQTRSISSLLYLGIKGLTMGISVSVLFV
ncbi:hypothetical protein LCM20_06640 [Halobacillus litoralis]|uniref:hypothetical protein n=1 Tax=Halobacillus litoralis TaxID=45668 RepID=UPI001CD6B4A6|nr:hypothetical protein [Halobacillus litoralis]MCA0970259.1 hypothetical protein [Halobacillus litoralis]